jgi:hypothetical protein
MLFHFVPAAKTNSMHRVMNALNWYGSHCEYIDAPDPKFDCKSHLVEQALRMQKVHNATCGGTAKPGSVPHIGLEDILLEKDKLLMVDYILY